MSGKGAQLRAQVNKLLTNVSNMYQPEGYGSETLLTPLPVIQDTGIIPGYGNGHLRIINSLRKGRGRARFSNPIERIITDKYLITAHELESEVTEEDYRNVEAPYEAEQDETIALSTQIMLEKEFSLASTLTDTSIITQNTTLSGGAQFSDFTNSDPIGVIRVGLQAVRDGSGMPANQAVMDWNVFNVLRYHPQVLENLGFKANRSGTLTTAEIAHFLSVDKLTITKPIFNSAKEGQPDTLTPVWGKHIVLFYAPASAAKRQVSLGYYVFTKNRKRVKKWNIDESFGNTGILVGDSYSYEITNTGAAYLIEDAIA